MHSSAYVGGVDFTRNWKNREWYVQGMVAGSRVAGDPGALLRAARVLEVIQSRDILTQYTTNQDSAMSALGLAEGQLESATEILQRVRELTIQAGGPSLTASSRQAIVVELRARYDNLMGIANAADGQGQFQFSGYQGSTKPFSGTADDLIAGAEITYAGDDGQRRIQVSATRLLEVSDSGSDVFMRTGNGESVFKTMATLIGQLELNDTTGLTTAITKIDQAGDNILRVRAALGSRMNEVESLGYLNQDLSLQYDQTLSKLQDLDYAKAISDLTLKQNQLQAAQESFSKISQLSLFDYLR